MSNGLMTGLATSNGRIRSWGGYYNCEGRPNECDGNPTGLLSNQQGLLASADGVDTAAYLVQCALSANQAISVKHASGT